MLSAPISGGDTAALNYQWTVNNQVVSTTSSYSVSPSLEVVGGNSTSNVVKVTVTEANDPAETSSYSAHSTCSTSPVRPSSSPLRARESTPSS